MADILAFPGNPGAPVQQFVPRPEFGQRRRGDFDRLVASCSDEVRAALDRQQQEQARAESRSRRRLAAEAQRAAEALTGKPVCPERRSELASDIEAIAQHCAAIAMKANRAGELRASALLTEHQHLLETLSAEVESQ